MWKRTAPFVLIDAPCTATGTIRRHPDLPWIKGAADVTVQAGAAYEILQQRRCAGRAGRHAGLCGLLAGARGRRRADRRVPVVASANFARAPITADEVFGHGEWITPDGDLRTLPFMLDGGMDGFYAARLKRA